MADEVIEAIETHKFLPVRKLQWRNAKLEFGSPKRLLDSLEQHTNNEWLTRARDADDVVALEIAAGAARGAGPPARPARPADLLWDVCRIPDFRGISPTEHAGLLGRVFEFLLWAGPG